MVAQVLWRGEGGYIKGGVKMYTNEQHQVPLTLWPLSLHFEPLGQCDLNAQCVLHVLYHLYTSLSLSSSMTQIYEQTNNQKKKYHEMKKRLEVRLCIACVWCQVVLNIIDRKGNDGRQVS